MERNHAVLESVRATRHEGPCVSIYLNKRAGRLSEEVTSIALYRELSYARGLLEHSFSKQEAADYLKPILLVAKDELLSDAPGALALFHSGDTSSCVRLGSAPTPRTVVAESFHVKPLVRQQKSPESGALQDADRRCRLAVSEGRAATDLFQVAQALKSGRAQSLWVAEDVTLWGVLNRARGSIVLHPRQMNDRDGDVLDDLVEWALDLGIELHVLPALEMPSRHPVIAEI